MLLYIDTLLQPRRQPSEPIDAGWNQIVITWAGGGGTGMQACLALDARPRMLQQGRASGRGTGWLTIWAVGELRLTAPAYKPLGGKLLELPARGHCGALFDPPEIHSIASSRCYAGPEATSPFWRRSRWDESLRVECGMFSA